MCHICPLQLGFVASDVFQYRAEGLYEGQNYFFRVSAENQCGKGPFIEMEEPVTAKLPYSKLYYY